MKNLALLVLGSVVLAGCASSGPGKAECDSQAPAKIGANGSTGSVVL